MASGHADLELKNDSLDFEHLFLDLKSLDYTTQNDTLHAIGFVLEAMDVQYSGTDNPLANLTAAIELQAQAVRTNYFEVEDVAYSIDASVGNFTVYPEQVQFFDKEGEGVYDFSPFAANPVYKVKYRVNNFRVETLLQKFFTDTVISGPMDINLDLLLTAGDQNVSMKGLNGFLNLYGHDLVIYGMDLDNLIKKYQKSQKFNLVDLGAVALAGPFGLAITKGSQFASLAIGEFGESTGVVEVVSEWTCRNGRFNIIDVAFTTEDNLVAGKGWVDLAKDSLNITVAVLNKYKCAIVSQSVYGKLSDPEYSEVDIVETLLGPVTNLLDGSQGKGCKPFYTGRLNHPLTEIKKSEQ
jgi:AsmA protein